MTKITHDLTYNTIGYISHLAMNINLNDLRIILRPGALVLLGYLDTNAWYYSR